MSGAAAGASDEPAFVLHSHAWSESSLIVETFTRTRGRVALVARGAKKPGSNFRPVLLPLQLLRLGWRVPARRATGDAPEIHALKSAEWAGGHVLPEGNALLGGLYCNELLLRLLARDDPHPHLFDHYAQAVRCLARPGRSGTEVAAALRSFELLLLRELGYLPALERQSASGKTLVPDAPYSLNAEQGLAPGGIPGASLPGADWLALELALAQGFAATLHATSQGTRATALQPQLRALLQYHCGAPLLRTRQLMQQLQDLWKP